MQRGKNTVLVRKNPWVRTDAKTRPEIRVARALRHLLLNGGYAMFDRILIPLDGSPRAELILDQVSRILRRKDSEIILLRVIDLPDPGRFEPARRAAYEQARGSERVEAHRYVHALAARLADRGVRARAQIAEGPAAPTILEQAKLEDTTLIAMTTHGRSGLSRWFMGSVAEKVVRASPAPVLVVRSFHATPQGEVQAATAQELPFRKVLVATDGSSAAQTVLEPVGKFAQLFDSAILLLHVEPPVVIPGAGEMAIPPVPPPTPSETDLVTSAPADRLRDLGLVVQRRTVVGDPAGAILDQSKSEEIDLIAMGTHGRTGFTRWFLGSVAERVLRHADVPLLLVRAEKTLEPDQADASPAETAAQARR